MITWMQKHNRYLVWTIWVATIAFIGAGFVGWGSYKYGSKASAVGKVGDIEISRERLNFNYSNLYNKYNDIFQGKFDEEQAKKMGLLKQSFDSLASQAQLLNLAKKYGIMVSEKELGEYIASMPGFQENGVFSKQVYRTYLQNRRIKSSSFESILSDELTIKKLMDLIEYNANGLEKTTVASALSIEDKVAYTVLSPEAGKIEISEDEIKKEWEMSKDDYQTPRSYKLAIYWTDTDSIKVDDKELLDYYDANSFNYADSEGKLIPFEEVKSKVVTDYKIKKGKKKALLDYIAVKKNKITKSETKVLPINDGLLGKELWQEIVQSDVGTLLKPKPAGSKYATVRIVDVIEPKAKPYQDAKEYVKKKLQSSKSLEIVDNKSKELLQNIDKADMTQSGYFSLTKVPVLAPMSQQESLQFTQKLFTSSGKKGIIRLSKRLVVYKLLDQRMSNADDNLTASVKDETDRIKKRVFENALFKKLNDQYPVKTFVKGI